ncbi:MAG TPA: DNA-directed RNA polymerase subunit H [Methanobacteriaceae archaeon]|nr:DNA-directed RNA polymerase subunit H [Methanobacteriaceae archaeon]
MVKKDILKHELVPDHVVLKKNQITKMLKEMDVHPEQLPKIKLDDPVAKAIEAKAGDIIKITRKSQTAGKFITYRLVLE